MEASATQFTAFVLGGNRQGDASAGNWLDGDI
jgi:hypothetical protein